MELHDIGKFYARPATQFLLEHAELTAQNLNVVIDIHSILVVNQLQNVPEKPGL